MLTIVGLAAENITDYSKSSDSGDQTEVSIVLLTTSLFITIALFSLFSVYILYKADKKNIYKAVDAIKNLFLILNAVILSFTILIFLPAIAIASELKATTFTAMLIFGGVLSLVTSVINTWSMLKA